MSVAGLPPSPAEFLELPHEAVAAVAPATAIYTAGGTRRSAMLQGVSPQSEGYPRLLRGQMLACYALFFRLGVRHLFVCAIRPGQLEEVGPYRERLLRWVDWGLAGPEALEDYARLGWRVQLLGADELPELRPTAERLGEATAGQSGPRLWLWAAPRPDSIWRQMLAAARATGAATQAELLRALLGEDVPPAGLQVSFGKPMVTGDIVPPALYGDTQCYWVQRPGYTLDEPLLRRILYDRAYLRPTWTSDKAARYAEVAEQRELWSGETILGLGRRAGGFWYPELSQGGLSCE